MNKTTSAIASILLAVSVIMPAQAENEVKTQMKTIGKSFTAAEKSDDLAAIKQELAKMREAAVLAEKMPPDHLKDQAATSADRKFYAEGMSKLLTMLDQAMVLANSGKLEETKSALATIKTTRNEYHKRLKP